MVVLEAQTDVLEVLDSLVLTARRILASDPRVWLFAPTTERAVAVQASLRRAVGEETLPESQVTAIYEVCSGLDKVIESGESIK